jgi:hypothetical protein
MEGQAGTTRRGGWGGLDRVRPGEGVEPGRDTAVERVKGEMDILEVR